MVATPMAVAVSVAVSIPMAGSLRSASLRAASKLLIDLAGHGASGVENAIWQGLYARGNA